jgi:endonuclease G
MARKKAVVGKRQKTAKAVTQDPLIEALRLHIRARGNDYLKDPNITSVGIGPKNGDGPISLQFTVGTKTSVGLEALGSEAIEPSITLPDGTVVLTDVIERSYDKAFDLVGPQALDDRRVRRDPIQPGISVSHPEGTAGTIGLIVFDRATGAPCVLSNWHVLHGNQGRIGDAVVQPGPFDNNNVTGNLSGKLIRSHLGNAGDCALARIEQRRFTREIFELGVTPARMARVSLGDRVVKSGRTTATTYGIVRRIDVIARINYGGTAGQVAVGGFEIGIDPQRKPRDGEISQGGDSGSAWMIARGKDSTDIFAGLHFAGETGDNADEHALACYPSSVQKKLDFVLDPPAAAMVAGEAAGLRAGYDENFLAVGLPLPRLSAEAERDTHKFEGKPYIPYTHFSVCLSKERRLARCVAWNIDGARIVRVGRDDFKLDPRVPAARQVGESVYSGNKLDRGHIARRADLVWGSVEEARQANSDSSYFTNIAPQHERYNQSSKKGLWGNLENLIFEQVDVQDLRVSVFGGALFGEDDLRYRGVRLPAEFWKLLAYVENGQLRTSAFVLSQSSLLTDIEALDLDPFKLFQVQVADLEARTGLLLAEHARADVLARPESAIVPRVRESLRGDSARVRIVNTPSDLRL